jgi:Ca2+-transporting ATPase
MVLSNLALIFANRRMTRSRAGGPDPSSRPLIWISAAAALLLGCVLGIPALGRLFAFATPTPALLLCGALVVGLNWLWFEAVKAWLRKTPDGSGAAPARAGDPA